MTTQTRHDSKTSKNFKNPAIQIASGAGIEKIKRDYGNYFSLFLLK